jgi:transcriptional regulator with XRE-family HTH domain
MVSQENFFNLLNGQIRLCIKELRIKSGLSQTDLANMLNKNQRTISTWETGKQEPSLLDLVKLRQIFGCSIDTLFCFNDSTNTIPNWLKSVWPDIMSLDSHGQEAVKALIKGLKK